MLAGDHDGLIYLGAAMATTAIGTLIPILRDAGEMNTRFGTYLLAAGAAGEFGPIIVVTLFFSGAAPLHEAAILVAFVAVAALAAMFAVRSIGRTWNLLERTLETSGQLAIRITVVIVFALVALASELGLDLLLGGFVAGIIVGLALKGREVDVLESKLSAIGYGFLIPFFFVYTGITFDIQAFDRQPDPVDRRADLPAHLPARPRDPGAAALRKELDLATASRSGSSARPSCRSSSRSRRSRSRTGTCSRGPPRPWSAPRCSRRRRCR